MPENIEELLTELEREFDLLQTQAGVRDERFAETIRLARSAYRDGKARAQEMRAGGPDNFAEAYERRVLINLDDAVCYLRQLLEQFRQKHALS